MPYKTKKKTRMFDKQTSTTVVRSLRVSEMVRVFVSKSSKKWEKLFCKKESLFMHEIEFYRIDDPKSILYCQLKPQFSPPDEGDDEDDMDIENWQTRCKCAEGTAFSRCTCGA